MSQLEDLEKEWHNHKQKVLMMFEKEKESICQMEKQAKMILDNYGARLKHLGFPHEEMQFIRKRLKKLNFCVFIFYVHYFMILFEYA